MIFLLNGGSVAVETLIKHKNVAVIEAFYPGLEGGRALAQSIFGDANRFGRLPYSVLPANWTDSNSILDHDVAASHRTYRYGTEAVLPFGFGALQRRTGVCV